VIGSLAGGRDAEAASPPAIHGYAQIWWTLYEELENGLRQAGSGDRAQQEVSGFSLRRARVSFQDTLGSGQARFRIEVLLEKSARLTDCFLAVRLADGLELLFGQMKIPSTYEVMEPNDQTDFIERASVSALSADWALSRTPFISTFMGNRAYLRDVGAGAAGRLGKVRCLAMVGNGLGANLFVGGKQNMEFIHTNGLWNWFYGLRVDAAPLDWLAVGGHGSLNRHDDMMFNDARTVIDLHRRSWSADALVRLPHRTRVRGLYAGGVADDDYYRDARSNFEYAGYEVKAFHWLPPERLEVGLRFDRYEYEFSESGDRVVQDSWTAGANYYCGEEIKVQANYVWRQTDQQYEPDLDDDALLVSAQLAF
jgi:hypothetical protein